MLRTDRALAASIESAILSSCEHLVCDLRRGETMQYRILVVIELEETATKVAESFKASGYKVTLCKDFSVATKILDTKSIALIVADVHPENGGSVFDFLRYAKHNPSIQTIPFVLFSLRPTRLAKYLEDSVRTTARLLGCDLFLSMEHFEQEKFRKKIDSLLPPSQESSIGKIKEGN